jgi:hypothetical protein
MKSFGEFVAGIKKIVTEKYDDLAEMDEGLGGIAEATVHLVPHGGQGTHFKVVKGIKGQLDAGEVIHDSHVDDLHDMGIKTKILKEDEMSEDEETIFEGVDIVDGEMVSESAPNFNAPERTKAEEIKIAHNQMHGDYKGHRNEMCKKHGIEFVKPKASSMGSGRQPFNEEAIEEGFTVGDMVRATNPKATPQYKVVGKNATHYQLQRKEAGRGTISLSKERVHRVNIDGKRLTESEAEGIFDTEARPSFSSIDETKKLDFDSKERNAALRRNKAADRKKDKDGFSRMKHPKPIAGG